LLGLCSRVYGFVTGFDFAFFFFAHREGTKGAKKAEPLLSGACSVELASEFLW
jgi:hypothetical protein